MPYRVSIVLGQFETHWEKKKKGIIPRDGEPSRAKFSQERYQFMLNAPFDISHLCCNVMKKNPVHRYAKETGRHPITAQMASESRLRTQKWLQNGCNGFHLNNPISNPMSFWTEQDVLEYISLYLEKPLKDAWSNIYNHNKRKRKKARKYLKKNNYRKTAICSVYGDIVEDRSGTDEVEGQMTISDLDGYENETRFDAEKLPLKTTGCNRTGCMFCGFGCHLEKEGDGRFERLKVTHPQIYDYIMRPKEQGGLNYKEIIDWINKNGNMNIRY